MINDPIEIKRARIRYAYTLEIMKQIRDIERIKQTEHEKSNQRYWSKKDSCMTIKLSDFEKYDMGHDDIRVIGEELMTRFKNLYIKVEDHTPDNEISFDSYWEYNYNDVVIPIKFIIKIFL